MLSQQFSNIDYLFPPVCILNQTCESLYAVMSINQMILLQFSEKNQTVLFKDDFVYFALKYGQWSLEISM